jgi:hypothetical protein
MIICKAIDKPFFSLRTSVHLSAPYVRLSLPALRHSAEISDWQNTTSDTSQRPSER